MRRPKHPLRMLAGALAITTVCMADDCSHTETGADKEARATQQLQAAAATNVAMPGVTNFAEKRELKMLYELRDNPHFVTWSYSLDLYGKRHAVCPTTSIGYPLPYSTQYTAGESMQRYYLPATNTAVHDNGVAKLPQPEPNGLYPPASADGTWVMCLSPDGKKILPVYVEPKVVAYPWEMPHVKDEDVYK